MNRGLCKQCNRFPKLPSRSVCSNCSKCKKCHIFPKLPSRSLCSNCANNKKKKYENYKHNKKPEKDNKWGDERESKFQNYKFK